MSTASPRDIIAAKLDLWGLRLPVDRADAILSALTAAGYRVVREGELDAATVERCMAEAYTSPRYAKTMELDSDGLQPPGSPYDCGAYDARKRIAALRALVGEAK